MAMIAKTRQIFSKPKYELKYERFYFSQKLQTIEYLFYKLFDIFKHKRAKDQINKEKTSNLRLNICLQIF